MQSPEVKPVRRATVVSGAIAMDLRFTPNSAANCKHNSHGNMAMSVPQRLLVKT